MRRFLIVGGSVGAGVILVLAMLSTVVSAQTAKTDEKRNILIQSICNKIKNNNWASSGIIDNFLILIFMIFLFLEAFLTGHLYY